MFRDHMLHWDNMNKDYKTIGTTWDYSNQWDHMSRDHLKGVAFAGQVKPSVEFLGTYEKREKT
jgi:hypothetical protein